MIETVLFDLDGTLCEYRRPGTAVLEAAFERVGVDPLFTFTEFFSRIDAFVPGNDTIEAVREEAFATLAAEAGADPAVGTAVAQAYAAERDHGDVRFLPGAAEALETLARDHRLGLVTNGAPAMQRQKLDALGIADAFEATMFAGFDAPSKPDPEPFHRVLATVDTAPERAVHVGNSLEADVAGARAAGMRSAWLPDAPDLQPNGHDPDYTLSSMADLTRPPWTRSGADPHDRPSR